MLNDHSIYGSPSALVLVSPIPTWDWVAWISTPSSGQWLPLSFQLLVFWGCLRKDVFSWISKTHKVCFPCACKVFLYEFWLNAGSHPSLLSSSSSVASSSSSMASSLLPSSLSSSHVASSKSSSSPSLLSPSSLLSLSLLSLSLPFP